MNPIGETLRRERLRLNLDLQQVARETKINLKFLQAIESEDFGKLPGGVFARSFVRQYAELLGLDPDELVGDLDKTLEPSYGTSSSGPLSKAAVPIQLSRPPDWPSNGSGGGGSFLPALGGIVLVVLACAAMYAWWLWERRPAPVAPQAAAVEKRQEPAPPPTAPEPAPLLAPAVSPEPQAAAPETTPPGAEPQSAQPAPVQTSGGSLEQPPESAAAVRLTLTAEESTWVSARSAGKVIYTGTLQPNQIKNLQSPEEIRLVLGNAGGVSITLNGKLVPALGPKGQVRVAQFSSGGVQLAPPAAKPTSEEPAAAPPGTLF